MTFLVSEMTHVSNPIKTGIFYTRKELLMINENQSTENALILRRFFIATALFIFFLTLVLPSASKKNSTIFGEAKLPDTSLFYSGQEIYQTAEAIGTEGRSFYVRQRISYDFIWPLVYAWFLYASLRLIYRRSSHEILINSIRWLPIIGLGFDYAENAFAIIIMLFYPTRLLFAERWLPIMSIIKWSSIATAFILIVTGIVIWTIRTARGREASRWEK